MGDAVHFRNGGLGGTDVHALVQLHGVSADDLAAQSLGDGDAQCGFACSGRAGYYDHIIHENTSISFHGNLQGWGRWRWLKPPYCVGANCVRPKNWEWRMDIRGL